MMNNLSNVDAILRKEFGFRVSENVLKGMHGHGGGDSVRRMAKNP
jgi:hypothetical protein